MKTLKLFLYIILILASTACKKIFFSPEPQNNPQDIFEYFSNDFNDNYAVFEERNVDWDSVYSVFSPQVNLQITDEDLFRILTQMVKPLNDGHVRVIAPDKTVFASNIYYNELIDDKLFNKQNIQSNYLTNDVKTNADSAYFYGLINNEIAYLYLPYIADNFSIINKVLDEYTNAKGLIVDLRHNRGGDFTFSFADFGRLTNEKRHVFTSKTKNGPGKNDYTTEFKWHIEPAGKYYDKKIVVLIDRFTISAGERTAMAFKVLPNVIMIGDTTNGAHSTMIGRDLANGWYYSIATQKVYYADGKCYEGIGMPPDMYFQNEMADVINGKDKLLEKAIAQF